MASVTQPRSCAWQILTNHNRSTDSCQNLPNPAIGRFKLSTQKLIQDTLLLIEAPNFGLKILKEPTFNHYSPRILLTNKAVYSEKNTPDERKLV